MSSRSRAMAQHRRGHSTGSMAPAKMARDEGLALFHEMQSRERTNFLHPSIDDIEVALTTKFGGISGYGFGASPPRTKLSSDLLGLGNEKNDYDWLLTPPGTPLFPSLDKDVTADPVQAARSRPKRQSSPSTTRKPSPSRQVRPSTPTGRPSTPGRSSTPNARRTLSPSSSFNPSTRSSSPLRKPKTVPHPATPALSSERPANLRTSFIDRSMSNSRGSVSASQNSDAGDARGRSKRPVSSNVSRSASKSFAVSSSGYEVTQRGDRRSVSPVNSQARKALKVSAATPLSSRKPFDSSTRHVTENRRPTTGGFRPLMSNSHLSSFYTRTSKPIQSTTESSINSCSIHGSDEEEVASKCIGSAAQAEKTINNADQALKGIDTGKLPPRCGMLPADVEMQETEHVSGVLDYSSDAPARVDLRHDAVSSVRSLLQSVIDNALDLAFTGDRRQGSQADKVLDLASTDERKQESQADSAVDGLACTEDRQPGSQPAYCQEVTEVLSPSKLTAGEGTIGSGVPTQCDTLLTDPEYSCSSMEVYQFDQELQTTGSEVPLESLHRTQFHTKDSKATGTSVLSRDSSLNLSGRSDQSKEVPGTKRSSKRPFHYAPAAGPGAKHYMSRKKDSRESSLFSIPISSSKGDSMSSGRPTSIDDTHSSVDTPRKYLDSCSSSKRYTPFEDEIMSEDSCVDYFIVQPSSRASRVPSQNLTDDDAEGYVDCFVDGYSQKKPQSSSSDFKLLGKAIEMDANTNLQEDETRRPQVKPLADLSPTAVLDVDSELLQSWEPEKQREEQEMEWEPAPSCGQLEDGPPTEADRVPKFAGTSIGAYSTESILFCSSVVHEIVYKAAALGIEKEDLKKLATPASGDELVTFLGLSKSLARSGGSTGVTGTRTQVPTRTTTTTTVRQSLAYPQNQKMMQNTTVSYMQGSLGRVQEDVKADLVASTSSHHRAPPQRKQNFNKCRCTIL